MTKIFCNFEGGEMQFTIAQAGQSAQHRRDFISFESVQFTLAQIEQKALCTFFMSFLQAPLRRCGLIVSSPMHCFLPALHFAEALVVASRFDSKVAKE